MATTASTTGPTKTLGDLALRPRKNQVGTMEAQLKQLQTTVEEERCARAEFRQSINASLSQLSQTQATPTPGPFPATPDLGGLAH